MRVCAVSLPELRIELVRSSMPADEQERPLAVVVAEAPLTERELLGNTRLTVVSREARALGVQPGQTIAQARARATELAVRVVRPEAVKDMLARIAEVGLAFGATVSYAASTPEQSCFARSARGDLVWIDITGCAHLHARSSTASGLLDGEGVLATRLTGAITSLGHVCFVAVADGPRIAAMLSSTIAESAANAWTKAKKSPRARGALPIFEPLVIPTGENARAVAPLPVSALPLAADDLRWLVKVGVRTIEELRALPKDGLGTRLGPRAREVLALATGDDRAPLTPYIPPEIPEETTTLEYGIEGTQALTFVAKTLTDRLAARLQGRAVAASRVELDLRLDGAVLSANDSANDTGGDLVLVALDLPAPLSNAGDILAALRPKIERLVLAAPVLSAKLRAPVLVHQRAAALSLFEPQPQAERALPRLVGELVSDLGAEAVSILTVGDSWALDGRSKLVPFGSAEAKAAASLALSKNPKKRRKMLASVPEPTRVLPEPKPVSRDDCRVVRHLSRLEAVEWWKLPPRADGAATSRKPLDYVQAWTDDGAAFVEIDRTTGAMKIRGWFD